MMSKEFYCGLEETAVFLQEVLRELDIDSEIFTIDGEYMVEVEKC